MMRSAAPGVGRGSLDARDGIASSMTPSCHASRFSAEHCKRGVMTFRKKGLVR
ncbi:hypothetical protein HY251_14905 [bacterium]|nr:hypothetical protein [bacterium]